MKKKQATKVKTAGKQLVRKGKDLGRKAVTKARTVKKKATSATSAASQRVKTAVKKAKPSAAVRKAGQLGRAVGGLIGQAINTAKKLVPEVVKK